MTTKTETSKSVALKPFTQKLLEVRPDLSLQSVVETREAVLYWDNREHDASRLVAILTPLLNMLALACSPRHNSSEVREFQRVILNSDLEETTAGLLATVLFQQLNDPGIRVTPGHKGTTPFEHSVEVMSTQFRSRLMELEEVLVLFFTDVFHDIGKSLSAGVLHIDTLMQEFETPDGRPQPHSHPDHAIISEMMLRALLRTKVFGRFVADCDELDIFPANRWEDVLLLIRHHHGFEKNLTTEAAQVGFSFEQVVLLFYFKFADACSTKAYRKDWPKAREVFKQWLEGFDFESEEVSNHARELAWAALKLDPELLKGEKTGNFKFLW